MSSLSKHKLNNSTYFNYAQNHIVFENKDWHVKNHREIRDNVEYNLVANQLAITRENFKSW